MNRNHANALLVASFLIFMFGLVIAIVTEILKGPSLVVSLSISLATAFGPIAIVTIFLKVGFEAIVFDAAKESLDKLLEEQKMNLFETQNNLNLQLRECEKQSQNLIANTVTLSVLKRCGIVDAFERRAAVYKKIKSWLRDRNNKEFMFVGTSFRGLYWENEGDPEIKELIKERVKEQPELLHNSDSLFLRFLFTHPAFAYLREIAEGDERPDGQYFKIREEILRSVLILRRIGIPEKCIKFFKGTPTLFGVMTDEAMFLNPYPYKKQSYTSFGLIISKVPSEDEQFSLYKMYKSAHFEGVWRDTENTVTWQDDRLDEFWRSTIDGVVHDDFEKQVPPDLRKLLNEIGHD